MANIMKLKSGGLEMASGKVVTLAQAPTSDLHAATKKYVDDKQEQATSSNKKWVVLQKGVGYPTTAYRDYGSFLSNLGATDFELSYNLPLPLHLNDGKALHIDQIIVNLHTGDSSDCIDRILISGWKETTHDTLLDMTTNYWTANVDKEYDFTIDFDAEVYKGFAVRILVIATTVNQFRFRYCLARFWYE